MNNNTQPPVIWCFRRWSRKPWAAFAGMRRFRYGHLSVAMSIILLATHIAGAAGTPAAELATQKSHAGPDSLAQSRTLHLDAVSVSARLSGAAATIHAPVSQTRFLVDRKETAPLGTAESALRLLPSVDVRERGGKSSQADIAIRGGSFDQTMVMLNGIDFSDPRTGHQSHSLPVDIDLLSDLGVIDVVTQPGALSGAVDFRTAAAFPSYLRARLEGGAWGYGYGNLSGAWSEGGLQTLGAVSYRRSDGYRPNTDFWNLNAYARVRYESMRAGGFDIQGGFQRRDWGSNGFYSLRYPKQFESTLTGLTSARWTKRWGGFRLEATGSFRRNNDRFEMVRDDPSGIPFNYHTSYGTSGQLAADYDWERAGTTSLGGNYTLHTMYSTAMGEPLNDPRHKIPGQGGALYPKRALRDIASAWAGHRKEWRRTWAGGRAVINHTPYGSEGTFAAEAGWLAGRLLSVKTDVLRTMRLPTFTDLFYNVATYHPDPDLKPETAMTYRLTVQTASPAGTAEGTGRWYADASVYFRDTKNVIDWEQRTDDRPGDVAGDWYSTQLNRLGTFGAELSAGFGGIGPLRTAMLNYGYTHTDKNVTSEYISKYALDYMRHKVSAIVGVEFARGFTMTLTGSFYDRIGSYIAADDTRRGYKPYFLLDGRLSWEPSGGRTGLHIYLDATNITGTSWFDYGGLPMPRTWLSGGIAVTIR